MNPSSLHAALEFGGAVGRRHARRLRQLADPDEVARVEIADPMDHVVTEATPARADGRIAEVMTHGRRPRREDGDVGTALPLQFQLRLLEALTDLIIADVRVGGRCAAAPFHAASCASRNVCSAAGAVV